VAKELSLAGVLPPIPTPFDAGGDVDGQALLENLEYWNAFPLCGYVVLGTNGEAALMDSAEKVHVLQIAREGIPEGRLLIAGTGCQSTRETISMTAHAARCGVDAALVLPPSYFRAQMTREALQRHYHAVADAAEIPLLIYNMPACTGLDLDLECIAGIASHARVVGIKDSGGDTAKLGALRARLGDKFAVLAGSAGFFLPALAVGAVGGVLALANIAPAQCLEIERRFRAGDVAGAADVQRRMIPANAAVTSRWSVAGLKAAMDMLGLQGGAVRPPLVPLGVQERGELESVLIRAGILSSPRRAR